MGRKLKAENEKRTERLMIYLTPDEAAELATVAEHQGNDKAKFVVAAIKTAIDGLTTPPESLAVSRVEKIMESGAESVVGYICDRGHTFWLNYSWPSPPDRCPCCGSKSLRATWHGIATKGYKRPLS